MTTTNPYVGKIFASKGYGEFVVTKYVNAKQVVITFIDTGYETITRIDKVRSGSVRDRLVPSVCGVGILEDTVTKICGNHTREYLIWKRMIVRCYDPKYHNLYSSYTNCEVSENFKRFSYFKDWCNKQVGFNQEGWHLDKDILVKGNKIYSEDTCCFVPTEVNNLLIRSGKARGNLPIGVNFHKRVGKFASQYSLNNRHVHLGYYDTPEEAFYVYKEAKEKRIKEVANKWKDQIDIRVYEALMNYEVEIDD